MSRSRAICCTKNNYTDDDVTKLTDFGIEKCTYLVYGKEVGKKGTHHLQIYFELKDAMTYTACQKKLFKAHYEKRKGHPKQAAGYCRKGAFEPPDDKPFDYSVFYDEPHETWDGEQQGEISSQGKRTDIDAPAEALAHEGATLTQIAEDYPVQFVKYHKGFQALRAHVLKPRSLGHMPEVIALWGPTGVGKTRDAYLKFWPDIPHYVWKPSNGGWWDGYDGQDKIIIDEFRAQMTWSDILGLLDRNEFRAPIKGGFVNIQASKFVITSPFPPDQWYKDDDRYDRFKQLERRITTVHHYKGPLSSSVLG
jgi:hypothetical protein